MKEIITKEVEETIALGEQIGEQLFPGAVITLNGDLGAGKTTFTKGIAKALGVTRVVNSPTFTIMKVYEAELPLYHMDVYRLEGIGYDYDLEEYIYGDGVCVIEWSENIKDSLEDYLEINIRIEDGSRVFRITDESGKYEKVMEQL